MTNQVPRFNQLKKTYNQFTNILEGENNRYSANPNHIANQIKKQEYVNATTESIIYIYNILVVVYLVFAGILSLLLLTLSLPNWLIAVLILLAMTFPFYIYPLEQYIYMALDYIYCFILSIEYTKK